MREYPSDAGIGVLGPLSHGKFAVGLLPQPLVWDWLQTGTFQAWVYLTSHNPNTSFILHRGDSLYLGIGGTALNHRPVFRIGTLVCIGDSSIPLNSWVHLGAEWHKDEGYYIGKIHLNGYPVGDTFTVSGYPSVTDSISLGGSRLDPAASINGYLDEAVCYGSNYDAWSRFTPLGGHVNANLNNAITGSGAYSYILAAWSFNSNVMAYDDIRGSHASYRGGATNSILQTNSKSSPYNIALSVEGKGLRMDHHTIFYRNVSGSFDCWINRDSFMVSRPTIISKGNTQAATTFRWYISESGEMRFRIGASELSTGYIHTDKWTHTAVTWKENGGSYYVKLYINGKLRNEGSLAGPMPLNNDTVFVGNTEWDNSGWFGGYIDELRIWKKDLTADEIKNNMFVSSKTFSQFQQDNIGAAWGFEGNLIPIGENVFTNFSPQGNVYTRFSSYQNENLHGAPSGFFVAHPSAINRNLAGGVFPNEFSINSPDKNVPAGQTISDTINITNIASLSNIEVFLSYQHGSMGQNVITLTAPNGQTRNLLNNNGGEGNDVLTFFSDGNISLTDFFPPWSNNAAPSQTFGNFGGTNTQGNWILSITNSGSTAGSLLGWGIRTNGTSIGIDPVSNNIPNKFKLYQNYPNPFNPATKIRFDIPKNEVVKITLYDILGKEVKVMLNEFKSAGEYEIVFNNDGLSSGMYFYKLESASFTGIKKLVLLK